jgi:hypothetical protein
MPPFTRTRSLAAVLPAGILLLVLLAAAAAFAVAAARSITFPYPLDYGEGPLLAQTVRLGHLEGIYRSDVTFPPYVVSNYPPVYPLVLSPLTRLWGPAFWYGRLISSLSIITAAVLIGLILRSLTGDPLASAIGALSLLAFPPAAYWALLYRVDALALALSLAGLYLCAQRPHGRWTVPIAALLLTAAIYTRQSYGLAAPLAACGWLIHTAGWRRAVALAASVAVLGVAVFALLDLASGGGFRFNIVTANINTYDPGSLLWYLSDLWTLMPLAVIGTGVYALSAGWFGVPSCRLIGPYLVGAVLSALTIGKVGSNVNYLLEAGAAVSLSLGALLAWQRPHRLVHAGIALLLILDMSLMVLASPYRAVNHARIAQHEAARQLLGIVHGSRGIVLADEEIGLLPLDGRTIYFQPFEMTQLARAGRWDQRAFLADIERQAFATLLLYRLPGVPLHRTRWTDEMLAAIDRRYVLEKRIGQTDVYRPRTSN